jgi:hypothetical protein
MGKAGIYFYKTAIADRARACMDALLEVSGEGRNYYLWLGDVTSSPLPTITLLRGTVKFNFTYRNLAQLMNRKTEGAFTSFPRSRFSAQNNGGRFQYLL